MRRFLLIVSIALFAVLGLSAIPAENVNADSILSLLLERGYDAALDADGDVAVYDQYGMEYWIIAYPEEKIGSGYSHAGLLPMILQAGKHMAL